MHSDLLFRTTFDGDDAYLYFLIEHQSSPDDLMAFRMLRYQVRIWERHLKTEPTTSGKTGLPMIVPVVLYQGHRRWTAPPTSPTSSRSATTPPPRSPTFYPTWYILTT